MDLIASIISWVLAFSASVLGNILAHDICMSADRTCAKIIRSAARRLAPLDRENTELEWLADLNDRETVREKYQHAIGCFLIAGKMRRQVQTVMVAMNFQIVGVGRVPLTLNLTSRFVGPAFWALSTGRFKWIKSLTIVVGMLYILFKFIKAANASLSPGFKITQEHLKQYKSWGYEAHIKRKGIDLNLSNIFRAMIHDPARIPELIRKISDALTAPNAQTLA